MRKMVNKIISEKEIIIKELRVRDIMSLVEGGQDLTSMTAFISRGNIIVEQCIIGLTFDELQDLAPSELKELYDAFREVNETFFDLAKSLGLMDIFANLKTQFTADLLRASVLASKQVMAPAPGITDTNSSPTP